MKLSLRQSKKRVKKGVLEIIVCILNNPDLCFGSLVKIAIRLTYTGSKTIVHKYILIM